MHAFTMGKVITISDEAYNTLSRYKESKDSFSKVILRKFGTRNKNAMLGLAGSWKNDKETLKIMKKIYNDRKNFKLRDVKFD